MLVRPKAAHRDPPRNPRRCARVGCDGCRWKAQWLSGPRRRSTDSTFRTEIRFIVSFARSNLSSDQFALLNCRRLPGRLSTADTAILLEFQEHDIAPLVAAKLLDPLGRPASNAPKYFAAVEIIALSQNRDWLTTASKALTKHWATKNRKKKLHGFSPPQRRVATA